MMMLNSREIIFVCGWHWSVSSLSEQVGCHMLEVTVSDIGKMMTENCPQKSLLPYSLNYPITMGILCVLGLVACSVCSISVEQVLGRKWVVLQAQEETSSQTSCQSRLNYAPYKHDRGDTEASWQIELLFNLGLTFANSTFITNQEV